MERALPIAIRRVSKAYGPVRALDGVDLDVRAGEFLTLLGPSGSGKTTLLMILAGFIRPDEGSVKFGDEEVVLTPPHLRNVGMVFQNYALFPHMTVAGNIGYPLKLRGVPKSETEQKVESVLATMGLEGFGDRRVHQLSGGQRQRVALARAIVFEPRILLMDEPLSALDKKLRDRMQAELRQLHDSLGMTTVYVTHDQREALSMSDRIAVINEGGIAQLDSPRAIYARPADAFVADFIGESALLPAQVRGGEIFCSGRKIEADVPPPDGEYFLLLRPEQLAVADGPESAGHNVFSGTVAGAAFQGDGVLLHVRLEDGTSARARIPAEPSPPAAGSSVSLLLRREHAVLIKRDGA